MTQCPVCPENKKSRGIADVVDHKMSDPICIGLHHVLR